jgi:hypothetical protein
MAGDIPLMRRAPAIGRRASGEWGELRRTGPAGDIIPPRAGHTDRRRSFQ